MNGRIALLGGSGFLGRWLARSLAARGAEVLVLSRHQPREEIGEWARADAREPESVIEALNDGDILIHLAHSTVPTDADEGVEDRENVEPFRRLLDLLPARRPALVAFFSTGGQYYGDVLGAASEGDPPEPVSAYGRAKVAMEEALGDSDLPWLVLRPGNPYGPYQELTNRHGVVPALMRAARDGGTFVAYGGGVTVRDYVYVEEAAEAAARLILSGANELAVNIGSGKGHTLAEVIVGVEEASGKKIAVENRPLRPTDVRRSVLDVGMLKKLTGHAPAMKLADGLKLTWEYFSRT